MNKILLNILMFVGFQQFILGTEVNKKIEPKKGVCLFCYTDWCNHNIDDPEYKNCPNCVKEVYSVCFKGHTMCAECILDYVYNGINYNGGKIKCICFNQEKPIGGKKIKPCKELINKKIVMQILDTSGMQEGELRKKKENLRERYIKMQDDLLNNILFLEQQKKKCKYGDCMGYFDITKGFICNKDKKHEHCGNCFDKIHEGECKNPLEEVYKVCIQQNEEIQRKIQNEELKAGEIEGYKPCPNCHQIIAKCGGCNHMTCGKNWNEGDWLGKGCGYQWCWRCGNACFCNGEDQGAPGNNHYEENNSCNGKHHSNKFPFYPDYFDDGDYFGIKNGKFKEQFEKLAKDMSIDVKVKIPTKYPKIKKIKWDRIIKARKKYQKEQQKKQQAVDDSINRCTECCCEEC